MRRKTRFKWEINGSRAAPTVFTMLGLMLLAALMLHWFGQAPHLGDDWASITLVNNETIAAYDYRVHETATGIIIGDFANRGSRKFYPYTFIREINYEYKLRENNK